VFPNAPRTSRFYRFGAFALDLRARELRRNGIKVRVPDQSIQVLAILLESPGEVVTREQVHQRLWPNGTIVEFDHSINAAVKRLRQALEDSAESPQYVETLPRVGYRFIASLEPGVSAEAVLPENLEEELGPSEGRIVSHYRVLEKIGSGSVGVVYKAEDTRLGRTVALKFLSDEFSGDKASLDRFQSEARAASALNHPNLCTLYDIGQVDGHPFLAMEFLEGQTLLEVIAAGAVEIDAILDLGIQIADALEAAHAKGMVHRDIKPSNIFVTTGQSVKIVDFGLVKMAQGEPRALSANLNREHLFTTPGAPVGTVAYMSPEQARGEELDARSDLFSFGVLLYEMATGQRPFQGHTTAVVFDAILNKAPITPAQLRPDLPPELELLIHQMLEKERSLRCQTASDIRDALERLRRDQAFGKLSIGSRVDPLRRNGKIELDGRRSESTPQKGRRWLLVARLVGATLAAVGLFYWFDGRTPATPHQFHQRRITANPEDLPVDSAVISPDGKYLGYSDQRGVHVQLVATGETQTMALPRSGLFEEGSWGFVSWYPDSHHFLASFGLPDQGASLWSASILGSSPRKLVEGTGGGAVSPDGSSISYSKDPGAFGSREIWLMGPQGESPHRILAAEPQSGFLHIKWSPAGNRILYQHITTRGKSVESCNLNGEAKSAVLSDNFLVNSEWIRPGRFIFSRAVEGSPVLASNLWELNVDAETGIPRGKERRLTDWSGFLVFGMSAAANGKQLAFLRGTYQAPVLIADVADDGKRLLNTQRLTADEYVNQPFAWTPDSQEVIFTSNRGGTYGIYRQTLDGSAPRVISAPPGLHVGATHLSPNGEWIVFSAVSEHAQPGEHGKLYRVSVGGGAAELIFDARVFDDINCTGPVANRCVYSSTVDGRELILIDFDPVAGKGKEMMRIPTKPDLYFHWALSPDGSEVAVLQEKTDAGQIQFIPVRGGKTRSFEVGLKGHFLLTSLGWAGDSKSLFVGTEENNGSSLLHIDPKGNAQLIWHQTHRAPTCGIPSPDGRHLAIGGTSFNTNAWLIDNF
jgi:eukaryotic-like serine/threonine-protein kinase